jgi:hypothetical protein
LTSRVRRGSVLCVKQSTYMDLVTQITAAIKQIHQERARHACELNGSQDVSTHLFSGAATFDALISAVQELSRIAPDDCDVFVKVGNMSVLKVRFIEPHTFSFEGFNQEGQRSWMVSHFSQLRASVIYLPKRGPSRVITGFSNAPFA